MSSTNISVENGINAGLPYKLRKTWQEVKKNRESYYLMAPYMILFILFVVLPVIVSVVLSFSYYNIIEPPKFIGWSNYKLLLLDDDVFLIALKNTFKFAIITGPVSYFACLLFAWFINELKPLLRSFATLLFYAPSIAGNVFFIWSYIFSGDAYGLVNGVLMSLGLIDKPVLWLQDPNINLYIIMLVQLWMSLGTSFLAFIAGLQGVDKTLYEAGAIDGIRNRWQELYHITLPAMKPQLIFGAIMQVTATFAVSDVCSQLAGFPSPLYSAHTIVLHMMDYGSIRYEMGYASAVAVILFLITVTINQLVRHFLKPD
ncbi:carbohydrate ABC transporter permease [Mahella australiensis]|uniref:Carbohydrate ABC transporter membrane protein 1, CUT1 family n=1 Tax=Mahella australiensis (strain DSM 15567 / CIP 107919 / 50-1 BON) TaxID=697281 RepID=F4A0T5_MAHA5|nr:sugar ABC transporter permease [Mahella australiensis]AEE96981.1 carbohydrate ABC transporter membrane protein 1, CUT1 family [Mahella australiensis 50-1 BON]